jgi:1-acyl-sn-glycerol-3-phosphate acyltransferase
VTSPSDAPSSVRRAEPSTGWNGHPRARKAIYVVAVLILHMLLMMLFGYRRHGVKRVPLKGPLLVIANHQSYLDSLVVGCAIYPRVATHLARSGLFKSGGFAALIRLFNAIPIREEEGDLGAMRSVIERLKLGDAVIIYPEGSRTHDGELQPFKRGVTLIAKKSGCTVLPVGVTGAYQAWPRWRKSPRLFGNRVRVMVGEPIDAPSLLSDGQDAALARLERVVAELVDELRHMDRGSPAHAHRREQASALTRA